MKIIIVGAGAVGSIVAHRLSGENHDVTLIESDTRVIADAQGSVDALIMRGNGASHRVLEEAGVRKCDILIAVTNVDEINILACLQAHRLGVPTKVARVRNSDYIEDRNSAFEGIDAVINPDQEALEEIRELLFKPAATDIYEFADGRVQVIGARVAAESAVVNKSLRELEEMLGARWALVAAITRRQQTIIPSGEDLLEENDHVFLVGRQGKISEALKYLARPTPPVTRVMIAGANRLGVWLAERLGAEGIHVKLIDPNEEAAERAGDRLPRALVLRGEATDVELLQSEGVGEMDGFVAVSEDEETNLTSSLLARYHGAHKTIVLIKRPDYVPLASVIGIDAAVSPRLSTASAIMRYFRSGNVLSLTALKDSEAEILELEATETSPVVDKPLATLEFPRHAVVGAIIKPYQVVVPRGGDVIEAGDKVLVFCLPKVVKSVQRLFERP
jgi:trk system potassium uptake protein TrkA